MFVECLGGSLPSEGLAGSSVERESDGGEVLGRVLGQVSMVLSRVRGWLRDRPEPWRPQRYSVTPTAVGADINYQCYYECDAGFTLDRSATEARPEQCCCGNAILVGKDAASSLSAALDGADAFRIDVQEVLMPWGETQQAALASQAPLRTQRRLLAAWARRCLLGCD